MAVEVVHKGRNGVGVADGTLSKIDRTEANDAIYASKARRCSGSADRLGRDGEAAEADLVCVLLARERAATVGNGDRAAGRLASRGLLARALGTAPGV